MSPKPTTIPEENVRPISLPEENMRPISLPEWAVVNKWIDAAAKHMDSVIAAIVNGTYTYCLPKGK